MRVRLCICMKFFNIVVNGVVGDFSGKHQGKKQTQMYSVNEP